jgi:hypothetical protein
MIRKKKIKKIETNFCLIKREKTLTLMMLFGGAENLNGTLTQINANF